LNLQMYCNVCRIPASFKKWVNKQLKGLDKFATEHVGFDEDYHEEKHPEGSVFGGFLSFSAIVFAITLCCVYIYTYFYFNVDVFNAFVPSDQGFFGQIEAELAVRLRFYGYPGCVGGALQAGGAPAVAVSAAAGEARYGCRQGVLEVHFNTSYAQKLSQGPTVSVDLKPQCPSCVENVTTGVKSCENCLVAAVSYIEWDISAPSIFDGDDNSVSGRTVPTESGNMFRGAETTEVEVALIPTYYKNDLYSIESTGFRVQFSDTTYGGSTSFSLNKSHTPGSNESLLDGYILDSEFLDEDVDNKVVFKLSMPLFSLRLNIWVTKKVSWLTDVGVIGGLITCIFALALAIMHKLEALWYDPEHPTRRALYQAQRALSSPAFSSFRRTPRTRQGTPQPPGTPSGKGSWGGSILKKPIFRRKGALKAEEGWRRPQKVLGEKRGAGARGKPEEHPKQKEEIYASNSRRASGDQGNEAYTASQAFDESKDGYEVQSALEEAHRNDHDAAFLQSFNPQGAALDEEKEDEGHHMGASANDEVDDEDVEMGLRPSEYEALDMSKTSGTTDEPLGSEAKEAVVGELEKTPEQADDAQAQISRGAEGPGRQSLPLERSMTTKEVSEGEGVEEGEKDHTEELVDQVRSVSTEEPGSGDHVDQIEGQVTDQEQPPAVEVASGNEEDGRADL